MLTLNIVYLRIQKKPTRTPGVSHGGCFEPSEYTMETNKHKDNVINNNAKAAFMILLLDFKNIGECFIYYS
jgi:hypothetical protein